MSRNKKLTVLVLEGNRQNEKVNNVKPISFQAYHVIEIFMSYLPKIELDGSSKLVIYFKTKPDNEERYMKNDYFNVSWYYVDESQIKNLNNIKKDKLSEYYLEIIVEVLKDIAGRNGREQELFHIIDEAARKVKDSNYEMLQRIKSLSKATDDKRYKANVFRHVSNLGEMWYVEFEDKNKYMSKHELMKGYSFVSKINVYKKARWENYEFILADKFDKVVAKVRPDL